MQTPHLDIRVIRTCPPGGMKNTKIQVQIQIQKYKYKYKYKNAIYWYTWDKKTSTWWNEKMRFCISGVCDWNVSVKSTSTDASLSKCTIIILWFIVDVIITHHFQRWHHSAWENGRSVNKRTYFFICGNQYDLLKILFFAVINVMITYLGRSQLLPK